MQQPVSSDFCANKTNNNKNVKFSLEQAMKVTRGSKGSSTLSLTSKLDAGGWSTRRPMAGLDVCRKSQPHPNSILGPSIHSESQYRLGYHVSDCSFIRSCLTVSMADNATHSFLHARPPRERHTSQPSINTTNCVYPMTIGHAGSYWLPTRGLLFIFDSLRRSQLTEIGIITLACAVCLLGGRVQVQEYRPPSPPRCVTAFRGLLPCLNVMSTDTNMLQMARASSHVMFMDLLVGKSHDIST